MLLTLFNEEGLSPWVHICKKKNPEIIQFWRIIKFVVLLIATAEHSEEVERKGRLPFALPDRPVTNNFINTI